MIVIVHPESCWTVSKTLIISLIIECLSYLSFLQDDLNWFWLMTRHCHFRSIKIQQYCVILDWENTVTCWPSDQYYVAVLPIRLFCLNWINYNSIGLIRDQTESYSASLVLSYVVPLLIITSCSDRRSHLRSSNPPILRCLRMFPSRLWTFDCKYK